MIANSKLQFVLVILAVAVVWLLVLPWAARRPAMKSHLQWLDSRGIDPSAMYYTELEVMDQILKRQRHRQRNAISQSGQ